MSDISDISNSLSTLERELEKLRSASSIISEAQESVTRSVRTTQDLSNELIVEVSKTKDFIIESIAKTRDLSTALVNNVSELSTMVVNESKSAVNVAVQDTISVHQASGELVDSVRDLIIEIHEFNIPLHFQQLESSFLAVNAKIEDLNNRLSSSEKNILNRIESDKETLSKRIKSSSTIHLTVLGLIFLITVCSLVLHLLGYI